MLFALLIFHYIELLFVDCYSWCSNLNDFGSTFLGNSNLYRIDRSAIQNIKNIQKSIENEKMNPNPIYLDGKHSMNYYKSIDKNDDAIVNNVQIVNSMATKGSSKAKSEISNVQMNNVKNVIKSDVNNVNIVNWKESRSWIDIERYNELLMYLLFGPKQYIVTVEYIGVES